MSKTVQSLLMALLGGLLISITISGRFTSYVKPGVGPLLLLAGAVLIMVGVVSVVLGVRAEMRDDSSVGRGEGIGQHDQGAAGDVHGHYHDRSRVPWLIMAPILVLLILAPRALGADAVTRNAGSQAATNRPTIAFPPLPSGPDPSLTIIEFVTRALYDAHHSASQNNITVVGFIAPPGEGYRGGYSLARLTISCCAADARPMRVHLPGTPKYPVNTWVSAVVSAVPGTAATDNDYVPTVELTSMMPVLQPADPYEH